MALANQFDLIKGQTLCLNNDLLDPIRKCILFDNGYNTDKGKVAMPFSIFEGASQKFHSHDCPESTYTIVEHLNKNRIDLGLYHSDVSKRLYVSEDCCRYWGNERFSLQIRYYTSLSAFLGYYPY